MNASHEPSAPAISVLLVEDDAPTSWRLQDALTKAGYRMRAAGTLADARAALADSTPKVLLTDLQLPDGHGVDLIRETRARFPDTEIMVISVLGDEESVISAITVGATGYLLKDALPTAPPSSWHVSARAHAPCSSHLGLLRPPQMNACLKANKTKLSDGCRKVVESRGG